MSALRPVGGRAGREAHSAQRNVAAHRPAWRFSHAGAVCERLAEAACGLRYAADSTCAGSAAAA
jgi:hypothetical protein